MTHGIFGAGANWRGIARKLVDARREWGVALVDLRGHGRSELGEPPHDLAACARDLRAVLDELSVVAVAGHSFGGKVALAARELGPIAQTWLLDASPSARAGALDDPANGVAQVLALLDELPRAWPRRDDFVRAVVERGHPLPFAQWLAMNVVPDGERFVLRLDLSVMRQLLEDYFARDLWQSLLRPELGDVEVVIAERSESVDDADRARLATAPPHVRVHRVAAGHWLHLDAPARVVELLACRLP